MVDLLVMYSRRMEVGMRPGDKCIAGNSIDLGGLIVRYFGVVKEVKPCGSIVIGLFDGSTVERSVDYVAVYIFCRNWDELYQRQKIVTQRKNPREA
jgi:hypothetical protein